MQGLRGSSRLGVRIDFKDKIIYEEPSTSGERSVFTTLRISEIDLGPEALNQCVDSLLDERSDDIRTLKYISNRASKRQVHHLEQDEEADKQLSGNYRGSNYQEKDMYEPLERIFGHITSFSPTQSGNGPNSRAQRKFTITPGMLPANRDVEEKEGLPLVSPDLSVIRYDASEKSKLWRDREAFVEVKPSIQQGPKPATQTEETSTIPSIVLQCADYAGIYLSACPFMLSCVGTLIFGTHFCVGIFDRDGITFSPNYDMFDNTGVYVFVRVVRAITHVLTIQQLGFDPTVTELTNQDARKLAKGNIPESDYPSYLVEVQVPNDLSRFWCTIGRPKWVSISLVGRGTNVWNAIEYFYSEDKQAEGSLEGPIMILKRSWRNSRRTKESYIYQQIERSLPDVVGVAKFECGEDVLFINSPNPISVENLRSLPSGRINHTAQTYRGPATPVLHCLVLRTVGRRLSTYTSERELLMGLRDALQAHKSLNDGGVLHRDISPGNVFLHERTRLDIPGQAGFLFDFDCAKRDATEVQIGTAGAELVNMRGPNIKEDIAIETGVPRASKTVLTISPEAKVYHGVEMTGTAQFMAADLLIDASRGQGIGAKVEHRVEHDIESFIWVFCHAVMEHLEDQARDVAYRTTNEALKAQVAALRKIREKTFGQSTPQAIADQRTHRQLEFCNDYTIHLITDGFMTEHLKEMFQEVAEAVGLFHLGRLREKNKLTHDTLFKAIDQALAKLPAGK